MASTRIYRTSGTPTNDKIFTVSGWFKFHSTSGHVIFGADGSNNTSWTQVRFSSDSLEVSSYSTSWVKTTRKFRDFSAWYHIVITCDSTQSTAADRIKWWVNGEQITDFSVDNRSSTSLNQSWGWNKNTTVNNIGGENASGYGDFTVAHFHNIDGTAYQASDFGETDSTTGVWKAKVSPSVTYGNNGYFLKFSSSGSMGTDSSGNGNDNTIGGSLTQTQDTPTNVFATINPLISVDDITYSNLNNTVTNTSTGHRSFASTYAVSSGKWYAEVKIGEIGGAYPTFGIYNADGNFTYNTYFTSNNNGTGYNSNGAIFHNNGTLVSGLDTWTTGDIIGVALDVTNNKVYFSKNGSWQNSADPSSGTNGTAITSGLTWYFAGHSKDNGTDPIQNFNFGNGFFGTTAVASSNADANGYGLFEYAVPTGFYSLCTKNINAYG